MEVFATEEFSAFDDAQAVGVARERTARQNGPGLFELWQGDRLVHRSKPL